jgi:hypothetical protein
MLRTSFPETDGAEKKKNLKDADQVLNFVRIPSAAVAQTGRRSSPTDSAGHMRKTKISWWARLKIRLSQEDIQGCWYPAISNPARAGTRAGETPARGTKSHAIFLRARIVHVGFPRIQVWLCRPLVETMIQIASFKWVPVID